MLDESSNSWLIVRELVTREEIRDYFHVRYQVYIHNGFISERDDELDVDPYDPYCRFVGAYDTRVQPARMIGGCRMILPGPADGHAALVRSLREVEERPRLYYAQKAVDVAGLIAQAERRGHLLVEFGRNVCLPEYRSQGVGMALVHGIYGVALLAEARWAVACCPPHLQSFYEQLGCLMLASKGVNPIPGLNTDVMTLVMDLGQLQGSDRQAQVCAAQLASRGYVQTCGHRDCLAFHQHQPQVPAATLARDEWSPREARLPLVTRNVELHDETLGAGLYSASATLPTLEARLELLTQMSGLGLESAGLGVPDASSRQLLEHPVRPRLAFTVTSLADAELLAATGAGPEVMCGAELVASCSLRGLSVSWCVEGAPGRELEEVLAAGAQRVILCDSSGRAKPAEVRALVTEVRARVGPHIKVDWRGSQDRGLAVANALAALEAGADRVHCTALGMGERAGHAPLEHLLEALERLAGRPLEAVRLDDYLRAVSRYCGWTLPPERVRSAALAEVLV